MELQEYLLKNNLTAVKFAVKSDVCVSSIYRILRGCKTRLENASRIEKATEGAIKKEELLQVHYAKRK
jgi:predicted transcriptional regulator